jgi:hypothetical protein
MKRVAVVALVLVVLGGLLLLFGRYEYVNRNGQVMRIDRLSGRTAVLAKSGSGGIGWMVLKTPEDLRSEQSTRPTPPRSSLAHEPEPVLLFDCPDQNLHPSSNNEELFKPRCDKDGNRVSMFR